METNEKKDKYLETEEEDDTTDYDQFVKELLGKGEDKDEHFQ